MASISLTDKAYFQQHGVVCLRKFIPRVFIDSLTVGFDKNMARPSDAACFYTDPSAPGLFRDDYCNWTRIDEFRRFAFESEIGACAATLLDAQEIRLFHDHIFFKKKGTVKKTPWHQDLPYYCVDGDQGISFWIPLTDIDESNRIEFISGSHAWNKLFTPKKFNGIDSYEVPCGLYEDLPKLDDPSFSKLSWTMQQGDVIAFDFRTIHGNSDNDRPNLLERKTVAFRFLGERMRFSTRPGEKSPPFSTVSLPKGAPLDHELFPIVWTKRF